jgi:hypothetical protein
MSKHAFCESTVVGSVSYCACPQFIIGLLKFAAVVLKVLVCAFGLIIILGTNTIKLSSLKFNQLLAILWNLCAFPSTLYVKGI